MKKITIIQVVKGIIVAYLVSAVILFLLAFLMYKWDISEGVIRGGIMFAYLISCFFCGSLVSKNRSGRKYLWGILAGVLYFLILLAVSFVCRGVMPLEISKFVPVFIYCALGGMIGGMFQASRK